MPGDVYFSVLEVDAAETIRRDYAAESWQGPSAECIGWWRSRVPTADAKPKLAPAEVMLSLFDSLADQPNEAKFRYVVGLLLIRKRLLRREETHYDESDGEILSVVAPKTEQRYELAVDEPDAKQAEQIQQRIVELLYADCDQTSHNLGSDAA